MMVLSLLDTMGDIAKQGDFDKHKDMFSTPSAALFIFGETESKPQVRKAAHIVGGIAWTVMILTGVSVVNHNDGSPSWTFLTACIMFLITKAVWMFVALRR
jgi:hypothetical protein